MYRFLMRLLGFNITDKLKRDSKTLAKLFLFIFAIVTLYSLMFQLIMAYEGRSYSIIDGIYWALVTMTTLGYGDIVFESDLGRFLSLITLMSGVVILLVILPYTFIQFFYTPWLEAQAEAKAPKKLPDSLTDHVIITNFDPIAEALIERLISHKVPYVILFRDLDKATEVNDMGYKVAYGEYDDIETWKKMRVDQASMVVALNNDMINTSTAFNIREINQDIPIITSCNSEDSVDILKLAGATYVFQIGKILGSALARRTMGGSARVHVIGHFEKLIIGEAPIVDTPLVGRTLGESELRKNTGMNAVGVWERGRFEMARPDLELTEKSVLVLVGSLEQMRAYDELFGIYHADDAPVIIIGGGRVGRAAAKTLEGRQIRYKIVEKDTRRIRNTRDYVVGDAADIDTLKEAGLDEAHTIIITSHDDEINMYLTIYCRKLRPDIQITSRATLERNINSMHRAGADFVMSYAKMGANAIFNLIEKDESLLLAEDIHLFKVKTPKALENKKIFETDIREKTGASIVSIQRENEEIIINPDPDISLKKCQEMVLIGDIQSEQLFKDAYN